MKLQPGIILLFIESVNSETVTYKELFTDCAIKMLTSYWDLMKVIKESANTFEIAFKARCVGTCLC